MNRAKLIAWAKSQGATAADCASVEALTKWCEANGHPVKFVNSQGTKSLSDVWAIVPEVRLADDSDEPTPEQKAAAEAERKAEKDRQSRLRRSSTTGGDPNADGDDDEGGDGKRDKGGMHWQPGQHRRLNAKKAYNRKAASVRQRGYVTDKKDITFEDADQAEISGAFIRQSAMGNRNYSQETNDREILKSAGIDIKANIGTTMTSGGATIPTPFDPTLIDLKNNMVVAQTLVGITPMQNDTWTGPRRTGGLTVYAPGQGGTITESNPTVDQVTMTATQMWTLTTCSLELLNDSAIDFIGFVAGEIKFAFDAKIETIYLNGDGTSTYFSYQGVRHKLLNLSATRAYIAGLIVATGDTFAEYTLGDFEKVAGRLPQRWDGSAGWLFHKRTWNEVVSRLALAVGGVTAQEVVNGAPRNIFLGYPVYYSDSMPRSADGTEGRDIVTGLLGDFSQGSKIGVVNGGSSIAQSSDRYFELGCLGIRGGYRAGVLVHDVGNADATESNRVAGPIVGIAGAAS